MSNSSLAPDFLAEVLAYIEARRFEPMTVAQLVKRNLFAVAGVRAVFDKQNKSGIPGLWPRLIRCLPLQGQVNAVTCGVIWMENKEEGRFNYLAGVEAAGDVALPEGFERIQVVAQTYVVFRIMLDGSALPSTNASGYAADLGRPAAEVRSEARSSARSGSLSRRFRTPAQRLVSGCLHSDRGSLSSDCINRRGSVSVRQQLTA